MNIKQLKRWEKIRTKGKIRFILINGVIIYGFSLAVTSMIIREFRQPSNDIFGQFNIIALIIYSVGGSVFGLLVWNWKDQEYLLRKDELTKPEEKKEGQASP